MKLLGGVCSISIKDFVEGLVGSKAEIEASLKAGIIDRHYPQWTVSDAAFIYFWCNHA